MEVTEMEQTVEYYMEKGRAENAAGNYDEAREAFTEAIKLNPDNAQAYYERGKVTDKYGIYYEDAEDDFCKALELDETLTDVYLELACYDILYSGDTPDCTEMLTAYVEGRPNDPKAYGSRAWAYLMIGEYKESIEDFTKAIDLSTEAYYDDYFRRGVCYAGIGKIDLALADIKKAISMNPTCHEYYAYRAKVYDFLNDFDKRDRDNAIAEFLVTPGETIQEVPYDPLTFSIIIDDVEK